MTQPSIRQQKEIRQPASLSMLVQAAWNLAHMSLWDHCLFSALEKENARAAIRQYLLQGPDLEKAYYSFCQRVLLAREYVNQSNNRFMPLPSHWLDANNATGFAGTEAWLEHLLHKRSSLPLYRREWKALAEAVLEMASDPSDKNFWYWKIYFLERNERQLWQLFLSIVASMTYK